MKDEIRARAVPPAPTYDAAALNPTVADLGGLDSWPIPPTPGLLAATRQNSGLSTWLAALPRIESALDSYDSWWREEFSREHDHFRLLGQDNHRRYLGFREIRIRVASDDGFFDIFARACAARVTGARVTVSTPPGDPPPAVKLLDALTHGWAAGIEFVEENDEQLTALLRQMPPCPDERIRFAAPSRVPPVLRTAAAASGQYLADEPVLAEGRVELLWYVREQTISHDYHRYGNLGARGAETRLEPG